MKSTNFDARHALYFYELFCLISSNGTYITILDLQKFFIPFSPQSLSAYARYAINDLATSSKNNISVSNSTTTVRKRIPQNTPYVSSQSMFHVDGGTSRHLALAKCISSNPRIITLIKNVFNAVCIRETTKAGSLNLTNFIMDFAEWFILLTEFGITPPDTLKSLLKAEQLTLTSAVSSLKKENIMRIDTLLPSPIKGKKNEKKQDIFLSKLLITSPIDAFCDVSKVVKTFYYNHSLRGDITPNTTSLIEKAKNTKNTNEIAFTYLEFCKIAEIWGVELQEDELLELIKFAEEAGLLPRKKFDIKLTAEDLINLVTYFGWD